MNSERPAAAKSRVDFVRLGAGPERKPGGRACLEAIVAIVCFGSVVDGLRVATLVSLRAVVNRQVLYICAAVVASKEA